MRRLVIGASTLAVALLLGAPAANAQFFVGIGATLPSSDYGDYAKTGWMATAGVRVWQSSNQRVGLWGEGFYGSNTHDDIDGDKTNLYGGLASVGFDLTSAAGATATPYLLGSVGYMVHQYKSDAFPQFEGSEGGLAFGGGGGFYMGRVWADARYITASIEDATTAFILISVGIGF